MKGKLRAISAALLFAAVAVAAGLSSAPQLHEWLHDIGDFANHECAATLLSSGGVEHSDGAPVFRAPQAAPTARALSSRPVQHASASLEFSLLEHAPPVLS